jgi:hypothetical protein
MAARTPRDLDGVDGGRGFPSFSFSSPGLCLLLAKELCDRFIILIYMKNTLNKLVHYNSSFAGAERLERTKRLELFVYL